MPVHNRRATPVDVGSNPTVTHRFRYNVHSGHPRNLQGFFLTFLISVLTTCSNRAIIAA